jgi:hypothetical protein
MDLQELKLGYTMGDNYSANLDLILGEISGSPLVELQGFKANQPTLTISLEKTAADQSASAAITGSLEFGATSLTLDCEADTDGVWSFNATAADIKLSGLLQQIASAAKLALQPLPGEFDALDIKQARFSFNSEQQVDIAGQ